MAFGLFVGAIALWYHVSAFCFLLSYFVSQLWTAKIKPIFGHSRREWREAKRVIKKSWLSYAPRVQKRWTQVNIYRCINVATTRNDAWFLDVTLFLWLQRSLYTDRREIESFLALEILSRRQASPKQIYSTQRASLCKQVSMEENVLLRGHKN